MKRWAAGVAAVMAVTGANPAAAQVTVDWADLTITDSIGIDDGNFVGGTITSNGTPVGVSINSVAPLHFVQTGGGTDYWTEGTPAPYTGGIVDNRPGSSDIVAFGAGGLKTITFDRAVSDVYLALVSWNGNAGVFNQPFEVISSGCGYWGCGGFTGVTPTSFVGTGELHGVIRFTGTFTSVSFTDLDEYWHGIQVGIGGIAPV